MADVEAQIVSISRGQPRWRLGFSYRRLPELTPSDATWVQEDEGRFEESYLAQLEQLGAAAILGRLEKIGGGRPVVALCWEAPGEWCHRRMLAGFLERETGQHVPELQHGDLPQRQEAPEMRLF